MDTTRLHQAALQGDRQATGKLLEPLLDPFYNLALRMLWHPQDAEDAVQDIVAHLLLRLEQFRGESQFKTWAWRIALNRLLTTRKREAEQRSRGFRAFGQDLDEDPLTQIPDVHYSVETDLLVEEVKVGCMLGMLLCLARRERAVYVAGEIFQITDQEAAEIFDTQPATYRKQLSRARDRVRTFMRQKCGLVNPDNRCRCRTRVGQALDRGRLDPKHLLFALPGQASAVAQGIAEMDELERSAALFRSHPQFQAPGRLRQHLQQLFSQNNWLK